MASFPLKLGASTVVSRFFAHIFTQKSASSLEFTGIIPQDCAFCRNFCTLLLLSLLMLLFSLFSSSINTREPASERLVFCDVKAAHLLKSTILISINLLQSQRAQRFFKIIYFNYINSCNVNLFCKWQTIARL